MAKDDGKTLFRRRFELLEELIARLAAQHRLTEDERQEVYSLVMLKVIQDDFAVLRRFRARSRWRTYLTVVVRRVLLDQRTREWGRWRPCAAARRLGPAAVELDRWINREGLATGEAIQMVRCGKRGTTVDELERLVERIPKRVRHRTLVSDRCLDFEPAEDGADRRLEVAEEAAVAERLSDALRIALGGLTEDDRKLLGLRFGRGWTVRRIADHLGVERRPLYRRFERLLRRLRWHLESRGLDWEAIRGALGEADVELELGSAWLVSRPGAAGASQSRSAGRMRHRSARAA